MANENSSIKYILLAGIWSKLFYTGMDTCNLGILIMSPTLYRPVIDAFPLHPYDEPKLRPLLKAIFTSLTIDAISLVLGSTCSSGVHLYTAGLPGVTWPSESN